MKEIHAAAMTAAATIVLSSLRLDILIIPSPHWV